MGFLDAFPFRRVPPPTPTRWLPKPREIRSRRPLFTGAGLLLYGISAYSTWFYYSLLEPDEKETQTKTTSDADIYARYDETAPYFDQEVGCCETTTGLGILRRRVVKQAHGHVLEVAAGTGRNFRYYDLKKCKSITFLDQSGPMLKIAKEKWQKIHPKPPPTTRVAFRRQSAMDRLEAPREGFDTIVQTMGICSTPVPSEMISYLGTLLNPKTGRLLLIEHGRGHYEWLNYILDKNADRHAAKFGCYDNRDIGKVLEESGLVVEKMKRPFFWNLGTVWVIEARPRGWMKEAN